MTQYQGYHYSGLSSDPRPTASGGALTALRGVPHALYDASPYDSVHHSPLAEAFCERRMQAMDLVVAQYPLEDLEGALADPVPHDDVVLGKGQFVVAAQRTESGSDP